MRLTLKVARLSVKLGVPESAIGKMVSTRPSNITYLDDGDLSGLETSVENPFHYSDLRSRTEKHKSSNKVVHDWSAVHGYNDPSRAFSLPSGRSVSALQESPDFSCCGNWRSVAAREGYCIHEPRFPARLSGDIRRTQIGFCAASAARPHAGGWHARHRYSWRHDHGWHRQAPHLAATLPLQKAGSPGSAASRDLLGARSMPRG